MCHFFQTCFKFSIFIYAYLTSSVSRPVIASIHSMTLFKVSSLQPQTCYQHTEIQTPYQRSSLAKLSTPEDRSQGMLLGAIDQHLIETAWQPMQNEVSQSMKCETNLLWRDFIFITSSNDILKKCLAGEF